MAFRGGRGRGRGRGSGFSYVTKPVVFEPYPAKFAKDLPDAGGVKEEIALYLWSVKLQRFWNSSAYYLKDGGLEADQKRKKKKDGGPEADQKKKKKKGGVPEIAEEKIVVEEEKSVELEMFFAMGMKRTEQKVELADFIKSSVDYVPAELADRKSEQVRRRKVRWNQESDLQKFDIFEKQEQKSQGQDENAVKGKKEEENEEEDDERIEDEEEEISDGDYYQNVDFDDDEDDFNMDDDNDDEGTY